MTKVAPSLASRIGTFQELSAFTILPCRLNRMTEIGCISNGSIEDPWNCVIYLITSAIIRV